EIAGFWRLRPQGDARRTGRRRARQEVGGAGFAGRSRTAGASGGAVMDRAWYWKAGFIVFVTLGALYALVPSWTYFQLPNEQRNEAGVFEQYRPKWAVTKRHLNLGLDLQGGIHLVMGVEVDRAVREKAVRRAEELAVDMDRRDIKG